jgi:hypothetical protein
VRVCCCCAAAGRARASAAIAKASFFISVLLLEVGRPGWARGRLYSGE